MSRIDLTVIDAGSPFRFRGAWSTDEGQERNTPRAIEQKPIKSGFRSADDAEEALRDAGLPGIATQAQLAANARNLGLTLAFTEVRRPDEIDAAFARITKERAGALLVGLSGSLIDRMPQNR